MPREPITFPSPHGVTGARLSGAHDDPKAELRVAGGQTEMRVNLGEYLIEWTRP